MANYYELLKVEPSASDTDIETAYETQYHQWRRLVTHHDPSTANQANQALQTLGAIRAILTDPKQRSAYDAGIGLSGAVGGLADPTLLLQSSPPTPPAPNTGSSPQATVPMAASALWRCPKCATDNPPQTKFCFTCGTQLVRQCPECKTEASLVATGMCGSCGYKYDVAEQRQGLRQQIGECSFAVNQTQHELHTETDAGNSRGGLGCGCMLLVIGFFWMVSRVSWLMQIGLDQVGLDLQVVWPMLLLLGVGAVTMFVSASKRTRHKATASTVAERLAHQQGQLEQFQSALASTDIGHR